MAIDLVEQLCTFQRKQRGKTEGGVKTYRWNLGQCLEFVAGRRGRPYIGFNRGCLCHGRVTNALDAKRLDQKLRLSEESLPRRLSQSLAGFRPSSSPQPYS
jgi:hypothetical protein